MNAKKHEIATVVTRLFTIAAGRTVEVNENVKSLNLNSDKCAQTIGQIEDIYRVKIGKNCKQMLTIEQIVDTCYDAAREKAIKKVKELMDEYHICLADVYGPNESIH